METLETKFYKRLGTKSRVDVIVRTKNSPKNHSRPPWEVIPNWSVVVTRSTGSVYECPEFKRKLTIRTDSRFGFSCAEFKSFSTIVDFDAAVVVVVVVSVGWSELIIFMICISIFRIAIVMIRYFYDSMESLIRQFVFNRTPSNLATAIKHVDMKCEWIKPDAVAFKPV